MWRAQIRLRDTQKVLLIGIFWATGGMAEEAALQSCRIEAASAVKADLRKPSKGSSKASDSAVVKKEALLSGKKRSTQNPDLMQDEKQLGLGCAQP